MKNEIIIFDNQKIKLEVNMKDNNVWLNREQISVLFERDLKTIGKHIKNALTEELDNSVVAKFATTARDGKTYNMEYYNLDMINSIGYRVKSKQGIEFRKWANKILKDYLIKGYSINSKRLEYLEKSVKLIDIAGRIDHDLNDNEAQNIIKVIRTYSNALDLLDDYDHRKINKPKGTISKDKISYLNCKEIIDLLKFSSESNIFGLEREKGLESIINNIYQSFDGQDLYNTIEEKAANFLYLITKNHTFIDGNKRIAATLFIYFLEFYNILYKNNARVIENNTLVALTLLIAESNPKEKNILIDLVMNFLVKEKE